MSRKVGTTPPLPPDKTRDTALPASRDKGLPDLDAYVTDSGISARAWCAWCRRWHSHGHCGTHEPLGAGNGHRVAHCHDPRSPYNSTGYTIREVGWWDHRPDWRQLPVICRPCGDAFYRDHSAARYCSEPCRRQAKAAA